MLPKAGSKDIIKIEVQVNKASGGLSSIKLSNKNGTSSLLVLSNFKKGIAAADNIFVFNAAKHKGVSVNDLR